MTSVQVDMMAKMISRQLNAIIHSLMNGIKLHQWERKGAGTLNNLIENVMGDKYSNYFQF